MGRPLFLRRQSYLIQKFDPVAESDVPAFGDVEIQTAIHVSVMLE